jgi:hypothetical protein
LLEIDGRANAARLLQSPKLSGARPGDRSGGTTIAFCEGGRPDRPRM